MSLLAGLTPPLTVLPCKVRDTLAELDEQDQAILDAAVKDPNWKVETLSAALRERGIQISANRIKHHRNWSCSCSKI
jgi:hypothetical protein